MTDNKKPKRTRLKKGDKDYINNEQLTKVLGAYSKEFQNKMDELMEKDPELKPKQAKEKTFEHVHMPKELSGYILTMARRICTKYQFSRYTYRDEMEADAVYIMYKGAPNFNGDKFNNGFSYLTQVAYSGIINRIKIEKKQADIKDNVILELPMDYLEDESYSDSIRSLQESAQERKQVKKENKNVKATFRIKNRAGTKRD